MRWLIVEDALRDRTGHWLEWVSTFYRGFRRLGDEVTVLADAAIEPDIRDLLSAHPILPASIWHRMSDGSGCLTRYSRVFTHAWQTLRVMKPYLQANPSFDAIFVPTMSLHHLLAWVWLVKGVLRKRATRVLLFFVHGPLKFERTTKRISSDGSPTAFSLTKLLRALEGELKTGKVVLGVETKAMQAGMMQLTGVPFVLFPQPVHPLSGANSTDIDTKAVLEMACYGAARSEKGSEILQEAIGIYRQRFPVNPTRFTLQWIEDFVGSGGAMATRSGLLTNDPHVRFVTRYFVNGEYASNLARANVLLLPYRLSSYAFRGSRVAIEAAINGIPTVVTRGTTLAEVQREFGSGLLCDDGSPQSLVAAMEETELRYHELRQIASSRRKIATEYFSVPAFRSLFLTTRGLEAN